MEVAGGRNIGYWCIGNVATHCPEYFHSERQRPERKRRMEEAQGQMERAVTDGWWNGWTALNDAISQRINGP